MYTHLFLLFGLLSSIIGTQACSTASATQSLGLSLGSWSQLYGATVNQDITITQPVLVDLASITAQGITIASGGALYFSWDLNIQLSANYIYVSSGAGLYIGTEACPLTNQVTITLTGTLAYVDPAFGSNFIGISSGAILEMHGAKALKASWTKLAQTANAGATQITVIGTTSTWAVGDQIVIATTDYSPMQSEAVTITAINGNTISFTPALQYMHFGQIVYGVDERAEVGLLTRNIKIQGAPQQQYFGGHLMIMRGFAAVHVEGVQFYNMGQDQIARYPFHFHLCNTVPVGTYVRYNAVYKSNFRCFTIHTTNGVLLQGNVAYDHYGHCYFLEDGIEQNNTIIQNLGILTRTKDFGQHIGSDITGSGVSTFWIANPVNVIEDNAAAGSFRNGFWFITRLGARGVSACMPEYQNLPYIPANQFLGSFARNSAHSCQFGMGAESTDWDANDVPQQTCDTPVANWQPTFANGTIGVTTFINFTAHHVTTQGVWARLPNIVVQGGMFADNYEAVEFATSGDHPSYPSLQLLQNSVVVGFSSNGGNNYVDQFQLWDSTCPCSRPAGVQTNPVNGMKIYDGAQAVVNVTFINFYANSRGDAALGARLADQSQIATTNFATGAVFQNVGTRYLVIDNVMDGGLTGNFRDNDGTFSGYANSHVLRNFDYYYTSNCAASSQVMLVCPHKYVQMWVLDMTNSGPNNNMIITRSEHTGTDHSDYALSFIGFNTASVYRYQPIVSPGAHYLIHFQSHVPSVLALQLTNADQYDSVGVAICYPPGTIIQSLFRGYSNYNGSPYPNLGGYLTQPASVSSAPSLAAAQGAMGSSYYWDSTHSILYVQVEQRMNRTNYGNFCPNGGCDFVYITASFTNGNAGVDCTNTAYSNGYQVTGSSWMSETLTPKSAPASGTIPSVTSAPAYSTPNFPLSTASSTSGSTPTAAPNTPAPTSSPNTPAPTSAPNTPAPTSAPNTPAPTSAPTPSATQTPAPTSPPNSQCGSLSPCGGACYNPAQYQCNSGQYLCPTGQLSCGQACYPPSSLKCVNGGLQPL